MLDPSTVPAEANLTKVRIEACSVCQLRCLSCSTGKGNNVKTLGNGYLTPDNFTKFLDLNPTIESVELSNFGEVFLNPKIADIFRIGYERNISLTLSNGANLNTISHEAIRALVKYQVRHMLVSIDGASQATYEQYRVGGDYNSVIRNIVRINQAKHAFSTEFPILSWQFIPFSHNEHEFEKAKALALKLGMEWKPKRSYDKKRQVATKEHDFSIVTRHGKKITNDGESGASVGTQRCMQLWNKVVVNWNGEVLGCCANSRIPFQGNAFETDLLTLTKGENYKYAQSMLYGEAPPKDDIACTKCWVYKKLVKDARHIDIKEIK